MSRLGDKDHDFDNFVTEMFFGHVMAAIYLDFMDDNDKLLL